MNRAFSVFEIKAFDDNARTFEGIASTPTPDRMGDVVEPKGAQFALPLPLLYQHDSYSPIGHIVEAKVTDAGIFVKGKVLQLDEPASLRERLELAWAEMKAKLVRGLSIGFNPLEYAHIKGTDYSLHFTKWDWLELSIVTIPANQEATITTVKRFDVRATAIGQPMRKGVQLLTRSSGVSANIVAHRGAVKLLERN